MFDTRRDFKTETFKHIASIFRRKLGTYNFSFPDSFFLLFPHALKSKHLHWCTFKRTEVVLERVARERYFRGILARKLARRERPRQVTTFDVNNFRKNFKARQMPTVSIQLNILVTKSNQIGSYESVLLQSVYLSSCERLLAAKRLQKWLINRI